MVEIESRLWIDKVIDNIKDVIGFDNNRVALHEPFFCGKEWDYVKDCIDSGLVSSIGNYVNKFEDQLAQFTGIKNAIAVVNGTAALHICLILGNVNQNDEVIIPSLTFVATANAVAYVGAIPHFSDISLETLGICPRKLNDYLLEIADVRDGVCWNRLTGRPIKAIMPMHAYGHPVEMDNIIDIAERFHLTVIEDMAESLGSYYKGKHTGHFGQAAALSFNGNKIVTTGGGGAILTNDKQLAELARHLTTTAKQPHPWNYYHDQTGFNYRLPNINAALGCAQLENLPVFIERKRKLAYRYMEAFRGFPGITVFPEPSSSKSNYWLNVLLLDEAYLKLHDQLLNDVNDHGIQTRPAWVPMHLLPMYYNNPKMDLENTESLAKRIINVPSSATIV